MDVDYLCSRYMSASALLPGGLRESFEALLRSEMAAAEEFRLRAGLLPSVLLPTGEKWLGVKPVTPKNLTDVLEIATDSSLHAASDSIKNGFVTGSGGHRIGICGTAIMKGGEMEGIRSVSSLALRISKEIKNCGLAAADMLTTGKSFLSALIVSPPGGGKTTLLRDVVRLLSNRGFRVSIADERGEIAAMQGGTPRLDVGARTDVLSNCPRDEAVIQLLRTMNPEIIAMDEITAPRDAKALESAFNCGVGLLATAHAADIGELKRRALYRELLREGVFKTAIVIERRNGERLCSCYRLEDEDV